MSIDAFFSSSFFLEAASSDSLSNLPIWEFENLPFWRVFLPLVYDDGAFGVSYNELFFADGGRFVPSNDTEYLGGLIISLSFGGQTGALLLVFF